ncbi:MAG: MarR family transcriptional regulator [Chloroflexi bacterium]|nr:MarR family transcriptional regulator [Chloroflexota bacterium]MBV9545622.1 MarR family transcriptional regulator [Chloroflexota bacterium]
MAPARARRPYSPALLAWLRLVRVFQQIDRASTDSLRPQQISPAQLDVLAKVGISEGINQQELADALLVTKGNVCQLLDKMESNALIERRPSGRLNRLFLTEKGRVIFETIVPRHDTLIGGYLGALSTSEQRELLRLLRRVDHSLERA